VLGAVAPQSGLTRSRFLVKFNHNEMLTCPNVSQAVVLWQHPPVAMKWARSAVGATIYFGNDSARDEIAYVSDMFRGGPRPWAWSPCSGATTTRSAAFKVKGADGKTTDYHTSADLSGQADHLGATIKADIIKQKTPPPSTAGYAALNNRRQLLWQVGQTRVHRTVRQRRERQGRPPDRPSAATSSSTATAAASPSLTTGGEKPRRGGTWRKQSLRPS